MEKRDNRLLKKRVFHRHIKFIATLILLIWFGVWNANGTSPLLTDFEIIFDWDTDNYSHDALPVYSDDDEIRSNENIFEFAYVINTIPKVKITINTDCSNQFILLIYAKAVDGNGFDICFADYNYTHSTGEFYFNVPIPGYITKFNFKWEWAVTAIPSCGTPCTFSSNSFVKTTEQHLYVILDEPVAPMELPWASVLNYACDWASGQTTEFNVVSKITEGAYNYLGKEYWGGGSHAYLPNFNLTSFLSASWADCRDMSAVVQVFTNALGGSNIRVRSIDYYSGDFYYKPICAIGDDCDDPDDWEGGYWNFHQFGYLNNVFDACLKLKQSAPRIPLNEPIQIGGSYETDLRQSGSWNIDNTTKYTYVY